MFSSWPLLWFHTAAATVRLALWHGHSQSYHRLCGQQQEQHPLNIKRGWEQSPNTDKCRWKQLTRPLLHSTVVLFITCLTSDAFLFSASAHFRPLRSCCIHSNVFYRLTMNHFFVCIFFSYLVAFTLYRPCVSLFCAYALGLSAPCASITPLANMRAIMLVKR